VAASYRDADAREGRARLERGELREGRAESGTRGSDDGKWRLEGYSEMWSMRV
jgi:hypothetical protein